MLCRLGPKLLLPKFCLTSKIVSNFSSRCNHDFHEPLWHILPYLSHLAISYIYSNWDLFAHQ